MHFTVKINVSTTTDLLNETKCLQDSGYRVVNERKLSNISLEGDKIKTYTIITLYMEKKNSTCDYVIIYKV